MGKTMFDALTEEAEAISGQILFMAASKSMEVYKSEQELAAALSKIKEVLPPDYHSYLLSVADNANSQRIFLSELQYRQGFSDGIKFIMQAMAWKPE